MSVSDYPRRMGPPANSATAAAEIEADTQAGLEARVPEGWQLVAVRSL